MNSLISYRIRFANYKGGKKYANDEKSKTFVKGSGDPKKVNKDKLKHYNSLTW